MNIYKINQENYEEFFKNNIGTDDSGAKIMSKKASYHTILIKDLPVGGANILKQDALSIGADLAVPMGTILAKTAFVDVVLIATTKHLEVLSKKELSQPFGLKILAKSLKKFIKPKKQTTQIMGVINANDDSFFDKSRFQGLNAIKQIENMIASGATIIDVGAVSSAPGTITISQKEELKRFKPICDEIKRTKLYKKAKFSIDSYSPKVIKYALENGFTIVNDITGLEDDKVAVLVAKHNATVVIMHKQGLSKDMQKNPTYDDVMVDIDTFFEQRIRKAIKFGIKKIMLDVGIGFGKTLQHNLTLLKNMEHFHKFGYPLLVGASRKSMINKIVPSNTNERLSGTLAIHLDCIKKGVSVVRVHDVKEHFQAIKVQEAIDLIVN